MPALARHHAAPAGVVGLDRTLAALADPHRRALVELLRQTPRRAGELAELLQLPAPTVSRHLRVLRESGLVAETHPAFDARVRIYELKHEPLTGLRDWLAETEDLWAAQLTAFKSHVERS